MVRFAAKIIATLQPQLAPLKVSLTNAQAAAAKATGDKELAAMEKRLKEMKREMAKAVGTAQIINISDYVNRAEEK